MSEINEQQLIREYLHGNQKSLEALIGHYLPLVYSFVCRYAGEAEGANDITQEVFIRLWKNLKKYNPEKNFKVWLFSIAKNASLDWLKKKKAIPFTAFENDQGENSLLDGLADAEPLPDQIFERQDLQTKLAEALGFLPASYRLVLLLHYNDHLNFREIAELLAEPIDTIKSRHRRAIIILRDNFLSENLTNSNTN